MRDALATVRDHYDFILIDCPPSLGLITLNMLAAADALLIPLQCEYYALEGLSQLLNTVHLVQQGREPDARHRRRAAHHVRRPAQPLAPGGRRRPRVLRTEGLRDRRSRATCASPRRRASASRSSSTTSSPSARRPTWGSPGSCSSGSAPRARPPHGAPGPSRARRRRNAPSTRTTLRPPDPAGVERTARPQAGHPLPSADHHELGLPARSSRLPATTTLTCPPTSRAAWDEASKRSSPALPAAVRTSANRPCSRSARPDPRQPLPAATGVPRGGARRARGQPQGERTAAADHRPGSTASAGATSSSPASDAYARRPGSAGPRSRRSSGISTIGRCSTLALVENLQRADLNPLEEAEGYQRLIDEFGFTQQQVAESSARIERRSRTFFACSAYRPPSAAARRGPAHHGGHARALLALARTSGAMTDLAPVRSSARPHRARGRDAHRARDDRRRVRTSPPSAQTRSDRPRSGASRTSSARHFQTDVQIQSLGGERGVVSIAFYSADDLERVLDLILGADREATDCNGDGRPGQSDRRTCRQPMRRSLHAHGSSVSTSAELSHRLLHIRPNVFPA